jgi:hypothetical protein
VEVDVGLDDRDEELCKPLLQLFYSLGASKETQDELEQTLYHFLNIKNKRKQNSREALVYPIVANAISKYGLKMDTGIIWKEITESIDGQLDDKNENIFHSSDDGDFYRSTTIGTITDKFGAELDHKEKGNSIVFNLDIFKRMGKQYDKINGIETKVIPDSPDAPDSPSRESSIDNPSSTTTLENLNSEDMPAHQYESGQSGESADDYPTRCYRCNFRPDNKQQYDNHCFDYHRGFSGYPNRASIEAYRLEPQGFEWEAF